MINTSELIAFTLGFIFGAGLLYLFHYLHGKSTQKTAETMVSQINLNLKAMTAEVLNKNSGNCSGTEIAH